jgi:hypothetical protein
MGAFDAAISHSRKGGNSGIGTRRGFEPCRSVLHLCNFDILCLNRGVAMYS